MRSSQCYSSLSCFIPVQARVFLCCAAHCILLFIYSESALAHNTHPLGKEEIDWQPDPAIARVFSLNFDAHAGHFIVAFRPPGGIESVEGRQCLRGPHFLFDIDDALAFDTDTTLTLDLLFERSDTNGVIVSWDRAVEPTARRIDFPPKSNDRWHRTSIKLEHARLANRKYEGSDLSIAALQATHPHKGSEDMTLTLCDMQVHIGAKPEAATQKGSLRLKIVNEQGQPDSARVGIYDKAGRAPLADQSALTVYRYVEKVKQLPVMNSNALWSGPGRYVFYVDKDYEAELAPGTYTLVASKGPEYKIHKQELTISAATSTEIKLELQRWIDMPSMGWYSGDAHIHIGRPDRSENQMIQAFARAEDIHVSNLLQMSNVATWHFPQYAFGTKGQFSSGVHALVPGQESPRTSHVGHTIGLNARAFHRPEETYFVYGETARRIHDDGGLFGYAHLALGDVFHLDRGLALDVPQGNVDFVEILQKGHLSTKHFYNFLNLGFPMLPAAGSDYPYIHIAGSERTYVKVGKEFSPSAWFEAWPKGRSFVTTAPIIEFDVNADDKRSRFDISQGDRLRIRAKARVNPDLDNLSILELVEQGEVIASAVKSSSGFMELDHSLQPESSTWFALRARGIAGSVAHTAPVYVLVDGNPLFWRKSAVRQLAEQYIDSLEDLRDSTPSLDEEWERFNTEEYVMRRWDSSKAELGRQINNVIESYRHLIKLSEQ